MAEEILQPLENVFKKVFWIQGEINSKVKGCTVVSKMTRPTQNYLDKQKVVNLSC